MPPPPPDGVILRPPSSARVKQCARGSPSQNYCLVSRFESIAFGMRTGGDKKCPSHLFFTDCEKKATRSATTFSVPANNWIMHLVSKFQPKVTKGQVTRSGQSKTRISDWVCAVATLSDWFEAYSVSKDHSYPQLVISDWYLWPEVRSISWPPHYKSMGKNSNRSYWMIMRQHHSNPS